MIDDFASCWDRSSINNVDCNELAMEVALMLVSTSCNIPFPKHCVEASYIINFSKTFYSRLSRKCLGLDWLE